MFWRCRATVCSLIRARDDLAVALPRGDQAQHLGTRARQPAVSTGGSARSAPPRARDPARAQTGHARAGRVQLESGSRPRHRTPGTPPTPAPGREQPHMVRRAAAKLRSGATCGRTHGRPGVAGGQFATAPRACAAVAPSMPPSAVPRRLVSSSALARRAAARVADAERDLDVSREQTRALWPLVRFGQRAVDRGGGGPAVALCESQQSEAGLRLAATAARVAVRLLGRRELSAQPIHRLPAHRPLRRPPAGCLTAAQRRPARRASSSASSQAPWRHMISARCVQAAPGERHHVRLPLAPARQRRGPLLGATGLARPPGSRRSRRSRPSRSGSARAPRR